MNFNILKGDCFDLIKKQPDNSVDLVVTSPPYADIVNYGKKVSIKKPKDYVDWLLPLLQEIHRVLKPSGSFILNINDNCDKGLRNTFIYELIYRSTKETDIKLYDTYFWNKNNPIPNGAPKRYINATEFIFHFVKNPKEMKFYKDRDPRDKKYNILNFKTSASVRDNYIKHPATYHRELPEHFVTLLTDEGDTVLDPFSGIATTGLVSIENNRNYIGYELNPEYADFSIKRLKGEISDEDKRVVVQYDLEMNKLKTYRNRTHAANETGLDHLHIMRSYSRTPDTPLGGYYWRLEKQ